MTAPARALRDLAPLLQRHRGPLLAASVLAMLLGAAWTAGLVTHVERAAVPVQEQAWAEEGRFTYRVPVERGSPVFPQGTVLGMGEAAYFSTISPRVPVEFAWSLAEPAPLAGLRAEGQLLAVVRAEGPQGRAYWALERPLASATLEPGMAMPLRLAGVLDLEALDEEVREVERSLGTAETRTTWSVEAVVAFAGDAPWGPLRNASRFAMPMERAGPLFTLPGEAGTHFARAQAQERVEVVERRATLASLLAAPWAPGLALAGAAGLALAHRTRPRGGPGAGALDEELARFAPWVTRVEGPVAPPGEAERVLDVGQLEDLVAVAAEARQRVVLDAYCRVCYVFTPGATYRYARHGADLPTAMALAAQGLEGSQGLEGGTAPAPAPATAAPATAGARDAPGAGGTADEAAAEARDRARA